MQYAGLAGFPGMPAASTATSSSGAASAASSFPNLSALGGSPSSQGLNQAGAAWWNMASQLAAQDYMTRLQQAAAADPTAYAALLAQGQMANYEVLAKQAAAAAAKPSKKSASSARSSPSGCESPLESLRLPSDTEIIKYTSSSTGPKVPGTTNRGRKKTISLDPSTSGAGNGSSGPSSRGSTPTIPQGLTIERKRPGRRSIDSDGGGSSGRLLNLVDKVEITKVPVGANNGRNSPRGGFLSRLNKTSTDSDPALNLSSKPTSAATISSIMSSSSSSPDYFGAANKKIPSDYYACKI